MVNQTSGYRIEFDVPVQNVLQTGGNTFRITNIFRLISKKWIKVKQTTLQIIELWLQIHVLIAKCWIG